MRVVAAVELLLLLLLVVVPAWAVRTWNTNLTWSSMHRKLTVQE